MPQKYHSNFKVFGKRFSDLQKLICFAAKISKDGANFLEQWFDEKDFIKVKTSGTTSNPKTIFLSKRKMINAAKKTNAFFDLPSDTKALLCLSSDFIAGKMMWVRAMVAGWDLEIVPPSKNPLKNLNKTYDFTAMVPLQLENSLQDLYKIKKLIVGGASVSEPLQNQLQSVPAKIYATYGMTETITHIAVQKLNGSQKESHYKTLPNIQITKDDRNCLVITAPGISEKKIITNDCVEVVDKNHFKWLGRYDDMINTGGIKLYPQQMEQKIGRLIKQPFFITALQDDLLGQRMILLVESNQENHITRGEKVRTYLGNMFDKKFLYPKAIYFLKEFKRTSTGKIQRKQTLEKFIRGI